MRRREPVKMPPEGERIQDTPWRYHNDKAWSRRFQWLPFDIDFDNRGEGPRRYVASGPISMNAAEFPNPSAVSIKSYIKDLNLSLHSALYRIIEHLFDDLVPLFNRSLVDTKAPGYQNQHIHLADITRDTVIKRDPDCFRPPEQRSYTEYVKRLNQFHGFIFVDLRKKFWNSGLQMVLQMQDINLTLAKPTMVAKSGTSKARMYV